MPEEHRLWVQALAFPLYYHLQGCYDMTTDNVKDDPETLRILRDIMGGIGPNSEVHLHYALKHMAAVQAAHGQASQEAQVALAVLGDIMKVRYGHSELSTETYERIVRESLEFAKDKNSAFHFPFL